MELPNKPKLIYHLKNNIVQKIMLNCIRRKERSILAQIRFGILPLHIKTGRFRGTALEERTC